MRPTALAMASEFAGQYSTAWVVWWAATLGLGLSVLVERLLQPAVPMRRPAAAWGLHAGVFLGTYGGLVWLLGRPVFAMLAVLAMWLTLVLVNNAKFKALREPFVFQDYEYFTDAIRHPRLYIPFMGWGKFLAATAGFAAAVAVGLWAEPVLAQRFSWSTQSGAIAGVLVCAAGLLWWGHRRAPPVAVEPERDMQRLGLVAACWRYAQLSRSVPRLATPFAKVAATAGGEEEIESTAAQGSAPATESSLASLPPASPPPLVLLRAASSPASALPFAPLLVSVQSESFFDARALWAGIRPDVLVHFDRLREDAVMHGCLSVPAWGANTVRTEFAFLAGLDAGSLGVHRFNPYRALAAGMRLASLASWLQQQGYRTICIHPYPASFYLRDRVFPRFGFDEFIDIQAFGQGGRYGPYVSDRSVGRRISAILHDAAATSRPVFIHAITMENHGPLHLERVRPKDIGRLYTQAPPAGCDDLTVYLRHLRNADRMMAELRSTMESIHRPASLCWFGDHVPIMPAVYQQLGTPAGEVEYAIWKNWGPPAPQERHLPVHDLARHWMQLARV